jgi:hypothetical protein
MTVRAAANAIGVVMVLGVGHVMFSTIVIDWASSEIGVKFSHRWPERGRAPMSKTSGVIYGCDLNADAGILDL